MANLKKTNLLIKLLIIIIFISILPLAIALFGYSFPHPSSINALFLIWTSGLIAMSAVVFCFFFFPHHKLIVQAIGLSLIFICVYDLCASLSQVAILPNIIFTSHCFFFLILAGTLAWLVQFPSHPMTMSLQVFLTAAGIISAMGITMALSSWPTIYLHWGWPALLFFLYMLIYFPLILSYFRRNPSVFSAGLMLSLVPIGLSLLLLIGKSLFLAQMEQLFAILILFATLSAKFMNMFKLKRELEQGVFDSKKRNVDLLKAKVHMIGSMSHEIRTPVNAIVGLSQLLLKSEQPKQRSKIIRNLMQSASNLLNVVDEFLTLNELEMQKLDTENTLFNIKRLLTECIVLLTVGEHKQVSIQESIDPDIPSHVFGNLVKIRQIINSLLTNALMLSKNQKLSVELSARQVEKKQDIWIFSLKIDIQDVKPIAEEELEEVIKLGSNADNITTRIFGASSLGLSICRNLAEEIGEKIIIESEENKQETLFFTMHLRAMKKTHISKEFTNMLLGCKILIVEPNEEECAALQEMVRFFGMQCKASKTFVDAKELIEKNSDFDLCLITHGHTQLDAQLLIEQLLMHPRLSSTPVIISTSQQTSYQDWQLNVKYILKKPISPSILFKSIYDILFTSRMAFPFQDLQSKQYTAQSFGDLHVLIVGDDYINQYVLKSILESYGCRLSMASNGQEACQMAKQENFDCIFMDCYMPVMDGYQAAEKIRKREKEQNFPEQLIIALTVNALVKDKEKSIRSGMDAFLTKPIKEIELIHVLRIAQMRKFSRAKASSEKTANPS